MQPTKIEYLTHVWNPIAMRCTPVSSGCKHCWHISMANRLGGHTWKDGRERIYQGKDAPDLVSLKELTAPARLKKPARIGLEFMGDIFHPAVAYDYREMVFAECEAHERHTFIVLTKRPEFALKWTQETELGWQEGWPRNIWFGVSVENQRCADERIPFLRDIPAALRFLSAEPMLGPIKVLYRPWRIGWVVCGGETGPGARSIPLDAARDLLEQSRWAHVPFFFKSAGPGREIPEDLQIREMPTIKS